MRIAYLKSRSKAYLAERFIRFVKTRVAECMAISGKKQWWQIMAGVQDHYNRAYFPNTKFRRDTINNDNFLDFLDEKWKSQDATVGFNTERMGTRLIRKLPSLHKMFKYRVGDRVIVSRKAHYTAKEKGGRFHKTSTGGHFSRTPYRVTSLQTRSSREGHITPVYTLKREADGKEFLGIVYPHEITKIKEV